MHWPGVAGTTIAGKMESVMRQFVNYDRIDNCLISDIFGQRWDTTVHLLLPGEPLGHSVIQVRPVVDLGQQFGSGGDGKTKGFPIAELAHRK